MIKAADIEIGPVLFAIIRNTHGWDLIEGMCYSSNIRRTYNSNSHEGDKQDIFEILQLQKLAKLIKLLL